MVHLAHVCSPLTAKIRVWQQRLQSHPDQEFASYICNGLVQGFRVGFNYPRPCKSATSNMPSARAHPEVVAKYLGEECAVGRIVGPFPPGQIPNLQVSRLGVIPKGKTSGKWRLITDLSFPEGSSINDGIGPSLCTLQYTSVDKVAKAVHRWVEAPFSQKLTSSRRTDSCRYTRTTAYCSEWNGKGSTMLTRCFPLAFVRHQKSLRPWQIVWNGASARGESLASITTWMILSS